MPCLSLRKKLLPAKKAWKSFTNTLQSKLHKLKNSKAIQKASHPLFALCSIRRPLLPGKLRTPTRPSAVLPRHNQHHHHYQQQVQKSFAPIYVDKLFPEPVSVHAKHLYPQTETSKAKEIVAASSTAVYKAKAKAETATMTLQQQHVPTLGIKILDEKALPKKSKAGETSTCAVADAWNAAVSSLPQLREVDERAEEFISKFREEMKRQREKSILDYQEMLARSA